MTFVPAAVIDIAPASTVAPSAVIRLASGIAIELERASPAWVAALARELARSAS